MEKCMFEVLFHICFRSHDETVKNLSQQIDEESENLGTKMLDLKFTKEQADEVGHYWFRGDDNNAVILTGSGISKINALLGEYKLTT